jgi:hypothetical protein
MPGILRCSVATARHTVSMKISSASVAATGVVNPKAHAARDHIASANRTRHTPVLRTRVTSPPHGRTRSERAIAETMSVVPVGRPRRPKPLERSARNAGRVPLERHVRRSTTEVAGSLPRRARDGLPGHAALDPPNRSRKMPRTATPGRVPGNGAEGTSPSETEAAESVAHPRPNGCSTTSTASPTPTEAGTNSTTAALERVPDCRRHVAPAAETVEVPRQLRSDGCPSADGTSPHPAEAGRRSVSPTLGRVPACRRCLALGGRSRSRRRTSAPEQVPVCRRCVTLRHRSGRKRRHIDARTGALVPTVIHPLRPKPKRDPHSRESDSRCPFADGRRPLRPKPKWTP